MRSGTIGAEKRNEFKISPASQFFSGLALCLWSVLTAAGGESTENKNKPVFPGFCRLASLSNRQTLLTDLTLSSGCKDSQATVRCSHNCGDRGSLAIRMAASPMSRPLPLTFGRIIQSHHTILGQSLPFFGPSFLHKQMSH